MIHFATVNYLYNHGKIDSIKYHYRNEARHIDDRLSIDHLQFIA